MSQDHENRCDQMSPSDTWPYVKRCRNIKHSGFNFCKEHLHWGKFNLTVYADHSIGIEDSEGKTVTFFDGSTPVAKELIKNLMDLGEL